MAHIKRVETKAGEVRYRVRFRANGRAAEKWYKTAALAKAAKTRIEADALDGTSIDPRAGDRTLDNYLESWLALGW